MAHNIYGDADFKRELNVSGSPGGNLDVLTSAGPGAAPTWVPTAGAGNPLTVPAYAHVSTGTTVDGTGFATNGEVYDIFAQRNPALDVAVGGIVIGNAAKSQIPFTIPADGFYTVYFEATVKFDGPVWTGTTVSLQRNGAPNAGSSAVRPLALGGSATNNYRTVAIVSTRFYSAGQGASIAFSNFSGVTVMSAHMTIMRVGV